jgi:hypothetical protein
MYCFHHFLKLDYVSIPNLWLDSAALPPTLSTAEYEISSFTSSNFLLQMQFLWQHGALPQALGWYPTAVG